MASQTRRTSFNIKLDLLQEGHAFSFFQAIRLLKRFYGTNQKTQEQIPVENMNIRVRPELSLMFPASDIVRIEELTKDFSMIRITATFLGLYGVSSPLPTFYTEDLFAEAAEDESITRDFLDIFNHRLYLILYRCLMRYRYFLQVYEERNPQFLELLFCLLGLGEKESREDIPSPYSLIRYLGLITQFPRSALGLKTMLQDFMGGIPVDIIPCMFKTMSIPEDQRTYIGISGALLGKDTILGEEIEDRMGAFRISIGPVNEKEFHALMPGKKAFERLNFLIRFYVTDPLEYDIEISLFKEELSTVCLGGPKWSSLGQDTWIYSGISKENAITYFQP